MSGRTTALLMLARDTGVLVALAYGLTHDGWAWPALGLVVAVIAYDVRAIWRRG